ncbi:MAG: ferritin family protein [Candidatus Tectomicrobia bacterium]|uniref:Ferritin family protein n=1 Tax=Tectimicrobiota bacterium TaxID=2528274 RepID=A0A932CQ85_UNCTE|nr:ferritin family protein [Candidatus Tectomicrobia bacterium]
MKEREIGLEAIIRDAIVREEEARRLFTEARAMVQEPGAKRLLTELAQEEVVHKQRLESIDLKTLQEQPLSLPEDLMITEILAGQRITPESSFQDVLILAMKLEKAAYELYTELERQTADPQAHQAFHWLAREELAHKGRLEKYYDEVVYKEN